MHSRCIKKDLIYIIGMQNNHVVDSMCRAYILDRDVTHGLHKICVHQIAN